MNFNLNIEEGFVW